MLSSISEEKDKDTGKMAAAVPPKVIIVTVEIDPARIDAFMEVW